MHSVLQDHCQSTTTRIQKVLPYIIEEVQSTFVRERLITNNVIVAFEIFHWLKQQRNSQSKYFAKDFDRIEWRYLAYMLRDIGFLVNFYKKIMDCVKSVKVSILINGNPIEIFRPTRGLR